MLISLDWIGDFVDIPAEVDPHELGEKLTVITAEVEGVEKVSIAANGLIVGQVDSLEPIADSHLRLARMNLGSRGEVTTVTAAPVLATGNKVVFAPVGSSVAKLGEIKATQVASHPSEGMIVPGDALGISLAALEAVFVGPELEPGDPIPAAWFDDWVVEIDNKSLTHRPDLWGHYGIAREIAAIFGLPLKPMPTIDQAKLMPDGLREFPIEIAEAGACRRYSGIKLSGVPTQPAPLWMQLRLGRTGLRPISGLVDLTNYVMQDIGQPMHAFDAGKVAQIEVDFAREGEKFTTLDGVERQLKSADLMILSAGKPVALAGVMGGLDSEVTEQTSSLLLESANFDPSTIRRTATRLGLRTDASARFEKSLDPINTVQSIQRFLTLAESMYDGLKLESRLSDSYPTRSAAVSVSVNPEHVSRMIGESISFDRANELLAPLEFGLHKQDQSWRVEVPTFRATNDISIEADVIEELARFVGYQSIEPSMPSVSMRRFEPNLLHGLMKRTLSHFSGSERFHEIFGYLWYDTEWLRQLEVDPGRCVTLRNPAAHGLERFRKSLMPGMLAATLRNRFHFSEFGLIELGSVFETQSDGDHEYRHVGLIRAARKKKADDNLLADLKASLESWAWGEFAEPLTYHRSAAEANQPWHHPHKTASIAIGDTTIGKIGVIDTALKRKMDEHLAAWSIAWAEFRLDDVAGRQTVPDRPTGIPAFPQVEVDFSFTVPASETFNEVTERLQKFDHPLHRLTRFVGSYEGKSVGDGKRSLTFRLVAGDDQRTLEEQDIESFRTVFESHLKGCGYEIRT